VSSRAKTLLWGSLLLLFFCDKGCARERRKKKTFIDCDEGDLWKNEHPLLSHNKSTRRRIHLIIKRMCIVF
jgi:hypothetical protein